MPNLGLKLSEVASLADNIMNYLGGDLASEQVIVAAVKESDEENIKWVSSSPSMRFLGASSGLMTIIWELA